jgi:hypothetical protein
MGVKLNRLNQRARRHPVIALIVASLLMGAVFSVVDAPGVENVVSSLDTDSAEAGRQYKYQCKLPGDLVGLEGIGGQFGIGSWQNTVHSAKVSAVRSALSRGWTASFDSYSGEWTIYETGTNPQEGGYITSGITCKQHKTRVVKDKKKR